jgi:hypothetical protein
MANPHLSWINQGGKNCPFAKAIALIAIVMP